MARPKSKSLTNAEQRIMNVLWDRNEASVREIAAALAAEHELAYTTVLTTTRILEAKGYVGYRKQGRTHIYSPLVSKTAARTNILKTVISNFFDGSPSTLAQHLLENNALKDSDIDALKQLLAEKEQGKDQ